MPQSQDSAQNFDRDLSSPPSRSASSISRKFKVLILGGGSGGISVAARLARQFQSSDIAIVDPSEDHFYQPLWTLVGAGVVPKEKTRRRMQDLIPRGRDRRPLTWMRESVQRVSPQTRQVVLQSGVCLEYEVLIVATGLWLDWRRIDGLEVPAQGPFQQAGVCSIYRYEDAERTHELLHQFRGGTALFVIPPMPIKCAGAPQKIMYLADEIFRRAGVRDKSRIIFATAGQVIFGIPDFARTLNAVIQKKGIDVRFAHTLTHVDTSARKATFQVKDAEGKTQSTTIDYDLLHVVPPMAAHGYVRDSGLAFTEGPHAGWLKVDPYSLQHLDYPEVFGIGDVTGIPNSKTGAAIRKQAPVVAANVMAYLKNSRPEEARPALPARYDGYSSCPLVTGFGKVVLAEFGYEGKLMPSFPVDATRERRSMWFLKKTLLPQLYWRGMLKGRL